MYAYLYSFIQKIILKKSLNKDAGNLLRISKFQNIIDIGCGESDVLNYFKISKNQKYFGFEIDDYFVKKLKKKYKKKIFIFLRKILMKLILENLIQKKQLYY